LTVIRSSSHDCILPPLEQLLDLTSMEEHKHSTAPTLTMILSETWATTGKLPSAVSACSATTKEKYLYACAKQTQSVHFAWASRL